MGHVRVCDNADDIIENKDTTNNIVDVVRTVAGEGIIIENTIVIAAACV